MATKTNNKGKANNSESSNKKQCWSGYERVPGKKAGSEGSCRKQTSKKK